MKPLKKSEKNIVIVLALTVFSFFLVTFIIDPAFKSVQLDARIKISRHKLEKYRLLLKKKTIYQATPDSQTAVSTNGALAELEKLTRETGVRVIEIRPDNAQDGKALSVGLFTEAREENYLRFLYELEHSNLRARRVQLSSKPNSEELEGSFSLSALGY